MFTLTIPKNAIPVGEIIEEEYRKPLGLTQQALADALGISRGRYAEIAAGKRGVTIDTALRFGRVFSTGPQLWINLQMMYDLSEAQKSSAAAEIKKLKPLKLDVKEPAPAYSAPRSRRRIAIRTQGPDLEWSAIATKKRLRVYATAYYRVTKN